MIPLDVTSPLAPANVASIPCSLASLVATLPLVLINIFASPACSAFIADSLPVTAAAEIVISPKLALKVTSIP